MMIARYRQPTDSEVKIPIGASRVSSRGGAVAHGRRHVLSTGLSLVVSDVLTGCSLAARNRVTQSCRRLRRGGRAHTPTAAG